MAELTADASWFRGLYVEMAPSVFGYARARLSASDAEDVTAEVFHAAVVAVKDGRGDRVTPAWLMGVTKNKIADKWRRQGRQDRLLGVLRRAEADACPEAWAHNATRDRVFDALDRVDPKYRRLLILKYVDSMPSAEIATEIGLSVRATESAIARARRALRVAFEEAGRQ